MRVAILRSFLCWTLAVVLPGSLSGQSLPEQSGGAILHTDGGVWVNGYEAHDSSAVFAGDLIETKPGASANLTVEGSTVLLAPESVGKYQNNLFELDHGVVSVVTNTSFTVRVNCIRVVPVANEWTKYVVADLNRTVQVTAQQKDVNVEHELKGKPTPESEASQRASVHEGEQKNYDETEICGAPPAPTGAGNGISPKWLIAAGAGGGSILICVVLHCFGGGGTSKPPLSSATP